MPNRVTGLSGMDIEGMVSSLMKVETSKVDKLYKQRTTLMWKQEAYLNMSNALTSFKSKFLETFSAFSLKMSSSFLQKSFSITTGGVDTKAISIKNTSLANNVEHKIKVEQTAKAQKIVGYGTGSGTHPKKMISGDVDFSALKEGTSLTLDLDGRTATVALDSTIIGQINAASDDDTKAALLGTYLNNNLASQFGDGLTAGQKMVKISGADGKLTFETEAGRTLKVSNFDNLYQPSAYAEYKKDEIADELTFRVTGNDGGVYNITVSTIDPSTNEKYETAEGLAAAIQAALGNAEDDAGNTVSLSENDFTVTASGNTIKFTGKSDNVVYTVAETAPASGKALTVGADDTVVPFDVYGRTNSAFGVTRSQSTDSTSLITVGEAFGLTDADLSGYSITVNGVTTSFTDEKLGITSSTTLSELEKKINEAKLGVTFSYNPVTGAYTMESTKTGAANGFTVNGATDIFGFNGANAIRQNAQDAVFELDGIRTSRETNDFSIGDLNISLTAEAEGKEITIKSSSNTDEMVKNIQEFLDSYNTLLKTFTGAYNETKAKSGNYSYYEPLTDEEKYAMSDKDVELWEQKAKQGLLARDSTVGRVADQMRSIMSSSVTLPDGTKISLSDIGIGSGDWRDMGQLKILDENKLRKALEERSEDVSGLFSQMSSTGYYGDRSKRYAENGLAYRLSDLVDDATRKSKGGNTTSYGWFVELVGSDTIKAQDNTMALKLKEINTKIWDLEQLNLSKENKYYDMFSKMEQAMTKAQNQMQMAGFSG